MRNGRSRLWWSRSVSLRCIFFEMQSFTTLRCSSAWYNGPLVCSMLTKGLLVATLLLPGYGTAMIINYQASVVWNRWGSFNRQSGRYVFAKGAYSYKMPFRAHGFALVDCYCSMRKWMEDGLGQFKVNKGTYLHISISVLQLESHLFLSRSQSFPSVLLPSRKIFVEKNKNKKNND